MTYTITIENIADTDSFSFTASKLDFIQALVDNAAQHEWTWNDNGVEKPFEGDVIVTVEDEDGDSETIEMFVSSPAPKGRMWSETSTYYSDKEMEMEMGF